MAQCVKYHSSFHPSFRSESPTFCAAFSSAICHHLICPLVPSISGYRTVFVTCQLTVGFTKEGGLWTEFSRHSWFRIRESICKFYISERKHCIDGLVQNLVHSSALAMELLQSCTKPSVYSMSFIKCVTMCCFHDDVIKWKHFPRYWPFVRGIHGSRWIPRTKASDAELWYFLWSAPE